MPDLADGVTPVPRGAQELESQESTSAASDPDPAAPADSPPRTGVGRWAIAGRAVWWGLLTGIVGGAAGGTVVFPVIGTAVGAVIGAGAALLPTWVGALVLVVCAPPGTSQETWVRRMSTTMAVLAFASLAVGLPVALWRSDRVDQFATGSVVAILVVVGFLYWGAVRLARLRPAPAGDADRGGGFALVALGIVIVVVAGILAWSNLLSPAARQQASANRLRTDITKELALTTRRGGYVETRSAPCAVGTDKGLQSKSLFFQPSRWSNRETFERAKRALTDRGFRVRGGSSRSDDSYRWWYGTDANRSVVVSDLGDGYFDVVVQLGCRGSAPDAP